MEKHLKPVVYGIEDLLAVIPDEEFYHITREMYCKRDTQIFTEKDDYSQYVDLKRQALNYVSPSGIGSFMQRVVYYWYTAHPSQKNYIAIDGLYDALNVSSDFESKGLLFRYGILDKNGDTNVKESERHYLVPIHGTTVEELDRYFEDYVEENLPQDAKNIELILTQTYNLLELDSLKQELKACNNHLDNYLILNEDNETIRQRNTVKYLESEMEMYRKIGVELFINVTDILKKVNDDWSGFNYTVYETFNEAVEEVLNLAKPASDIRKVMIYSYDINNLYKYFAVYMKYFHNIACLDVEIRFSYLELLGETVYKPSCMLAADRLLYLRNFPTYSVKVTDFGVNTFLAINRTLKCSVTMIEIDDDLNLVGDVSINLLDVMNLSNRLVNITSLFNFDKGVDETRQANYELKSLFAKFYQKMKQDNSSFTEYPTPCNTLVIESGDHKYLARVDSIAEMNIEGYVSNLELQSTRVYSITEERYLYGWVPLRFWNDEEFGKSVIQNLLKRNGVWNNLKEFREVTPYYTLTKEGFYYRYLFTNIRGKKSTYIIPNTFVVANLNSPIAVSVRNSKVWLEVFKNNPKILSQLTCFKCSDATSLRLLDINVDETMIAENYLDGGLYE